jgi:hypothetical protein
MSPSNKYVGTYIIKIELSDLNLSPPLTSTYYTSVKVTKNSTKS